MTAPTPLILVVEDEPQMNRFLRGSLSTHGYRLVESMTGADGLAQAAARCPDVILLDLGLPDMDGRDVCRELRLKTKAPIIMLTARSEEFDRVLGLELGADDYVTKPFSFRELVARIRAVSRRSGSDGQPAADDTGVPQAIGGLRIDRRTRRVFVDEVEVQLTAKEFDLLAFLAEDIGAVRTRTEILENVWDAHWYGPTKTVDAHVASLRKKLGGHEWIQAVRGVGFRLEPPE